MKGRRVPPAPTAPIPEPAQLLTRELLQKIIEDLNKPHDMVGETSLLATYLAAHLPSKLPEPTPVERGALNRYNRRKR